ncbi:hypothetical protein AJ80_04290 [Polytolypa hystricis UAMH7299]|uniref:Uncharacterized protein n=1 Tax=Polytolypa hystricis (strain UAMH7299) TaxID=1447883 RepID=A0A2B7YD55_POLH7|nr:hypothetical protein AJ80_04290 [Polytolypa hystricis UAMH7299]
MKTSKQYIIDITHSKPILRDTLQAFASGKSSDLDDLVSKSGYSITGKDLKAAQNAAESGSHFNIAVASGLYRFNEPQDLKDHQLMVNPANGRIYIDDKAQRNHTTSSGDVTWTDDGYTYTITFSFDYDDEDGTAKPITFSGTREKFKGGDQDTVTGEQIVKGTDLVTRLLNHPVTLSTAFICTFSGVTLGGVFGWIVRHCGGEEDETATIRVREVLELATHAMQTASRRYEPEPIHYNQPSMRADLEREIQRSVNHDVQNGADKQVDVVHAHASNAAIQYLEGRVRGTIKAEYQQQFQSLSELLHKDEYESLLSDAEEMAVERSLADRMKALQPQADYLRSVASNEYHIIQERKARERAQVYQDAMSAKNQELQEINTEKENKERARKELADQKEAETDAAHKAQLEAVIRNLDVEIAQLERKAKEKQHEAAEEERKRDREVSDADREKKDADDAKRESDNHADRVYHEGKK